MRGHRDAPTRVLLGGSNNIHYLSSHAGNESGAGSRSPLHSIDAYYVDQSAATLGSPTAFSLGLFSKPDEADYAAFHRICMKGDLFRVA